MLKGGKGSGFKNVHQDDDNDDDPIKLFRVQSATGDNDARAMQVREGLKKKSGIFQIWSEPPTNPCNRQKS